MDNFVPTQMRAMGECFSTVLARIRATLGVHCHVARQMSFPCKTFSTFDTFERLFIGMRQHVTREMGDVGELFVAQEAVVWLLRIPLPVPLHVDQEGHFILQRQPTQPTLEDVDQ